MFSRILAGLTTSLTVADRSRPSSASLVGAVLGIIAGFAGGWIDWGSAGSWTCVLSFPQHPHAAHPVGRSCWTRSPTCCASAAGAPPSDRVHRALPARFFGWPFFARIIRGQVLSLREREFIEAAESLGAKKPRLYFKELLPHLWAPILVYTTLILPANIAAEAALSFLGVGIKPPDPVPRLDHQRLRELCAADPAYFLIPGLTLFILVLAFNLLGDGLRDALDPKSGRS